MADYAVGNKAVFKSVAEATNPTTGTVMADSGALTAGNYVVGVIVGQSAVARYTVQRRNAANGANVGDTLVLYGAAGQSGQYQLRTPLEAGERIRVVMTADLTGTSSVLVNTEKLL